MAIFLCLGTCSLAFDAAAQDDSISTDRPDIVDSSDVVPRKALQFEVGTSYARDTHSSAQITQFSTPLLIRYGLTSNFELRFATDGRVVQHMRATNVDATNRGFGDLSLGFKWHIDDGKPATPRPAIAMELSAEFPTGSDNFKGDGVRPTLRGIAEWVFSDSVSLGLMSGATYDRSSLHDFWNGVLATSVDFAPTESLRGFVEVAGQQLAHAQDGGVILTADTGLAYVLTRATQVDFAIFRGLNATTPNWTIGAGFSIRL